MTWWRRKSVWQKTLPNGRLAKNLVLGPGASLHG